MLTTRQITKLNSIPGFAELRASVITRSLAEWVKYAEDLAAKHGGILPNPGWLHKNKHISLQSRMIRDPEAFAHIPQDRKRTLRHRRTYWVALAERIASENGGTLLTKILPQTKEGVQLMWHFRKHPELFAHIPTDRPQHRNLGEWVTIAEDLARDHDGVLPATSWLNKNGYRELRFALGKNPEAFSHIKQGVLNRTIALATRLAGENGGLLPNSNWLIQNGHWPLYRMMKRYPKTFTHIKQVKITRDHYKTFLPFKKARAVVRAEKLSNFTEFRHWRKQNRPNDIPAAPAIIYKEKGWVSCADWLGRHAR